MIPIVTGILSTLASNGLGMLAGAIQAKGKEVIEEKLGVKIPSAESLTPELLQQLKIKEMEHEEYLVDAQITQAKIELDSFKEEVKDRGSARERDSVYIKMGQHNWRADIMFLMAVLIIGALVWIVWKDPSINEYVKGIFTLVLGRFLGYLDNIYNFEFGTTRGSKDKDATIKQLTGGRNE